jgi:hypothetical protein
MKPSLLLALALSLPTAGSATAAGEARDDPAQWMKDAIARDWKASANPRSGDLELASPIYPMRFNQGCVIHRLTFLADDGRPALDHLVATDNYFAFAVGEACATADPAHFFEIHAGSDTFGVMDFARRLKAGPQPGRDSLSRDARARLPACFLPDAMRSTRITRASSRRVGGAQREEFMVVLACDGLKDGEEIYATGSYRDDAVHWEIGSLVRVDAVGP